MRRYLTDLLTPLVSGASSAEKYDKIKNIYYQVDVKVRQNNSIVK